MRLWQRPVDDFLAGGLGTLPLAPLCAVSREALPGVIRRMEERLDREAPPSGAATLWTSTFILMGLRYPAEIAAQLLRGVRAMKESTTYQAILAEGRTEGRADEARRVLLFQGAIASDRLMKKHVRSLMGLTLWSNWSGCCDGC